MQKIKNFFEKVSVFSFVLAQQYPPADIQEPGQLIEIIEGIVRWIVTLLVVFSAIYIVMAGFNYVTSGGDEDKINKAKTQLLYGLVGVGIAVLALGLPRVIHWIVYYRGR